MTEPTITPAEEAQAVEALQASITVSFEDHGVTWWRKAKREWTRLAMTADGVGFLLMVVPHPEGGFGWVIEREADKKAIRFDRAPTRPEARKHAVAALGVELGEQVMPELAEAAQAIVAEPIPFDVARAFNEAKEVKASPMLSRPMRVAAGAFVVVAFAFAVGVLVAAVIYGVR